MRNKPFPHEAQAGRRDFLKGILLTGGAAAVAVVAKDALADTEIPEVAEQARECKKGYHITQHILDYYKTTYL
jgi:hypothetical protein